MQSDNCKWQMANLPDFTEDNEGNEEHVNQERFARFSQRSTLQRFYTPPHSFAALLLCVFALSSKQCGYSIEVHRY